MAVVVRGVAIAPFDATPDAPRVRPSWQLISRGLALWHLSTGQYRPVLGGEAGCHLIVNSFESKLSSLVSWRGGPPGARLPSMHHRRSILSAKVDALVRAQHHPDNMHPWQKKPYNNKVVTPDAGCCHWRNHCPPPGSASSRNHPVTLCAATENTSRNAGL